jgi:hypothetical protein
MSLTCESFKAEVDKFVIFKDRTEIQWESNIQRLDIHNKFDSDLNFLEAQFVRKIGTIRENLRGDWFCLIRPYDEEKLRAEAELLAELTDQLNNVLQKETRLVEAFACCLKEQELRKAGLVKRTPHHTDYYADYTNGNDAHSGMKSANLTIDSTADTTHFVDAELTGADDYITGDFLWNVTRSAGSLITAFVAATDTVTLGTAIVGMTAGDSYYYIAAIKRLNPWASATRVPGDRLFLRANTTWNQGTNATDIAPLTDGTIDSYISIIGCDSVTNDPWHDGSNVKPIIDFQDAAYQIYAYADAYWNLERLDLRQSNDVTGGLLYLYYSSNGWRIIDCDFSDNAGNTVEGIEVSAGSTAYLEGCGFTDCFGASIKVVNGSLVSVKDCTIDAGAVRGSVSGFYAITGSTIIAESCSIAPSNAFVTSEIHSEYNSNIYLRNCTFGASAVCTIGNAASYIYSEDNDGTFEAHWSKRMAGTITRGTTLPRSGGADSYAILAPDSTRCGPNEPLVLGALGSGFAKIWMSANAASTITLYVRVDSAWDSALAANECYMTASYLDSVTDCGRTLLQSTETISNSLAGDGKGVWTALTVTIPANYPKRDGWVYVWLHLAEYEDATEYVHVDILPVVS